MGGVVLEGLGERRVHARGVGGVGGPLREATRGGGRKRAGGDRGGGGLLPWPGTPRPVGALIEDRQTNIDKRIAEIECCNKTQLSLIFVGFLFTSTMNEHHNPHQPALGDDVVG